MNSPNAFHGRVDGLGSESRCDQDDFDFEEWLKNQTLPMELGPARAVRLRRWLKSRGFTGVQVEYRAKPDDFRITMRCGTARCKNHGQAETWLRRAAEECGAEPKLVIAIFTEDGQIRGALKCGTPRTALPLSSSLF
jgi:hypothetical protein